MKRSSAILVASMFLLAISGCNQSSAPFVPDAGSMSSDGRGPSIRYEPFFQGVATSVKLDQSFRFDVHYSAHFTPGYIETLTASAVRLYKLPSKANAPGKWENLGGLGTLAMLFTPSGGLSKDTDYLFLLNKKAHKSIINEREGLALIRTGPMTRVKAITVWGTANMDLTEFKIDFSELVDFGKLGAITKVTIGTKTAAQYTYNSTTKRFSFATSSGKMTDSLRFEINNLVPLNGSSIDGTYDGTKSAFSTDFVPSSNMNMGSAGGWAKWEPVLGL